MIGSQASIAQPCSCKLQFVVLLSSRNKTHLVHLSLTSYFLQVERLKGQVQRLELELDEVSGSSGADSEAELRAAKAALQEQQLEASAQLTAAQSTHRAEVRFE